MRSTPRAAPSAADTPAAHPFLERWWHAVTRRALQDPERGDVPGWVLVTLMTAGLVITLWALAGPALADVFTDAIASVRGPG